MMIDLLALKLRESLDNENPFDPDWYETALAAAMRSGMTVEEAIWHAVRRLLAEAEQRTLEKNGAAGRLRAS